jgi:uncharacterized membrane protein
MIRSQQPALTLFAVGMIGLGILALVYGDFAMVWQPVASWIPGRSALAYGSGLVMLLGGTGLFMRATAAWSARLLFPYLIGWLLLKVPALLMAPQTEAVWLGVGELAVLLAGGWVLFARLAGLQEGSPLSFATGQNGLRIARILFAVALIPIGLSHIVYVKPTADLVPAWLPYRMGWAYVTSAGQIACGLGVMFSVLPRVAARTEAGMISRLRCSSGALRFWPPPRHGCRGRRSSSPGLSHQPHGQSPKTSHRIRMPNRRYNRSPQIAKSPLRWPSSSETRGDSNV